MRDTYDPFHDDSHESEREARARLLSTATPTVPAKREPTVWFRFWTAVGYVDVFGCESAEQAKAKLASRQLLTLCGADVFVCHSIPQGEPERMTE